ncbi:MAG: phosphate ABC transporter permease subunit PstC [Streptosporangiales bacterium]
MRAAEQRHDGTRRLGDRMFSGLASGSGLVILAILAGVALFLLVEAWPAISAPAGDIPGKGGLGSYVAPLAFGTVLSSAIALVVATPLAVAIALFITHYAPRSLGQGLGYLVDVLAAIPSIVYGMWGVGVLTSASVGPQKWLGDHLGFIPFFAGPVSLTGRTMLVTGLVLAVMILPIITAIVREIFLQTPALHQEAALALGATRWEMIRTAVLPFGKSGIMSGAMLGLGRALGETMAVAFLLSSSGGITVNLIGSANPGTIAANIALDFPYANGLGVNVLIATGLVLFAITLAVNMTARAIVNRGPSAQGGDL